MALSPTQGFVLVSMSDPLGNGQETLGIGYVDANGTVKRAGVWIINHAGSNPELVVGAADSDAAYQVTTTTTTITVAGGSLLLHTT